MSSYSTTLLPSFSLPPLSEIDHIIFNLWDRHLEIEFTSSHDTIQKRQHLEVTAAIINYWEEILIEINKHEIKQRRLNSSKDC